MIQAADDDNAKIDDAGEEIVERDEDVVVVALMERMNMLTAITWTTSAWE